MPLAVENRRVDLAALFEAFTPTLSIPLCFGLGAGLYFEYIQRPNASPSRFIIGINRNLKAALESRASAFSSDTERILRAALRENALLFNLDRAPTTALLGMEMLAEQLADFQKIPDWQICLREMRAEIAQTGSCYRRIYLMFLREIQPFGYTIELCSELSEIADEWDGFAAQLAETLNDAFQLERASRMLRKIAFREEHFWGKVMEL